MSMLAPFFVTAIGYGVNQMLSSDGLGLLRAGADVLSDVGVTALSDRITRGTGNSGVDANFLRNQHIDKYVGKVLEALVLEFAKTEEDTQTSGQLRKLAGYIPEIWEHYSKEDGHLIIAKYQGQNLADLVARQLTAKEALPTPDPDELKAFFSWIARQSEYRHLLVGGVLGHLAGYLDDRLSSALAGALFSGNSVAEPAFKKMLIRLQSMTLMQVKDGFADMKSHFKSLEELIHEQWNKIDQVRTSTLLPPLKTQKTAGRTRKKQAGFTTKHTTSGEPPITRAQATEMMGVLREYLPLIGVGTAEIKQVEASLSESGKNISRRVVINTVVTVLCATTLGFSIWLFRQENKASQDDSRVRETKVEDKLEYMNQQLKSQMPKSLADLPFVKDELPEQWLERFGRNATGHGGKATSAELEGYALSLSNDENAEPLERARAFLLLNKPVNAEMLATMAQEAFLAELPPRVGGVVNALELAALCGWVLDGAGTAIEYLDRAAYHTNQSRDPVQWARVSEGRAVLLMQLGRYVEAVPLLEQIHGIHVQKKDYSSEDAINTRSNLASALIESGQYAKARQHLVELEPDVKRSLGEDSEIFLTCEHNIAVCMFEMGQQKQAVEIHSRVLQARTRLFGADSLHTLGSRTNLIVCSRGLPFAEVITKHREIFQKCLKQLGPDHPATLQSQSNIAVALGDQGSYKQSEEEHKKVLEARKRTQGNEHPDTIASRSNLAVMRCRQGHANEAEKEHRQILEMRQRVLGPEHPSTLESMNLLAVSLGDQGKNLESQREHERALEIRQRVLGPKHPDTLATQGNLVAVMSNLGKNSEAEAKCREILPSYIEVFGDDDGETLEMKSHLAVCVGNQNKNRAAEIGHRNVFSARQKLLGDLHPSTLLSQSNLAAAIGNQGRNAESESIHRAVLEKRTKALGPEHPNTIETRRLLTVAVSNQGRYAEAEVGFREILALSEKAVGPDHPDTLAVWKDLATSIQNQWRHFEAEAEFRRVHSRAERALGTSHPLTTSCWESTVLVLQCQDKYDQALRECHDALRKRQDTLEAGAPALVSAHGTLATLYYWLGDFPKQLQEREQVCERLKQSKTTAPIEILIAEIWRGYALKNNRRLKEAEECIRTAVSKIVESQGLNDRFACLARGNLADTWRRMKRIEEAEKEYASILKTCHEQLDPSDQDLLTTRLELARCWSDQGKREQSISEFRDLVHVFEKHTGKTGNRTLQAKAYLAHALRLASKAADALPLFRECYELTQKSNGKKCHRTLVSAIDLAECLFDTGATNEATRLATEIRHTINPALPVDDPVVVRLNKLLSQSR